MTSVGTKRIESPAATSLKPRIYLNAGNLWTLTYLKKVIELNHQHRHDGICVGSLFGSIGGLTPTARPKDRIPHRSWPFIEEYVKLAAQHNISVRYTLNQSCVGPIQEFRSYWDHHLEDVVLELSRIGVHEWTVTSPLVLELLRGRLPNNFIEVSTIAEVSSLADALRWKALGANGVNVSTSVNRDFEVLTSISAVITATVLANEACLYRCPYRRECYNLSSHDSQRSEDLFKFYPFRRCSEIRAADPVEWLKSRMVLPQRMSMYRDTTGIQWFKIAYRTHPEEVAIPILEAYMNQYYGGNLLDLWPTIAHLGGTRDPKDDVYIPCDELNSSGFMSRWLLAGSDICPSQECGLTCRHCYTVYNRVARKLTTQ